MTDTKQARHELGWLVDDDDVEQVNLPELSELRRQWPVQPAKNAPETRDEWIAGLLDAAIGMALVAVGVLPVVVPGN